jgi:MOSC domain-containing protein YiiM
LAIIHSVNIGHPRPLPGKSRETGIYKEPVDPAFDAVITRQGVEGDAIINRKHHGGVDQALYLYFSDDYRWWETQLGTELKPGTFGENLTIGGVEGRNVAIGDRFTIDEVVLEVTSHRTPCATFAIRMGDPGWVKRFFRAGRPGAYCRVIEPGALHASEPVLYKPYAGDRITMGELLAVEGRRAPDPEFMQRVLKTPVHYKMRADYQERLAQLF